MTHQFINESTPTKTFIYILANCFYSFLHEIVQVLNDSTLPRLAVAFICFIIPKLKSILDSTDYSQFILQKYKYTGVKGIIKIRNAIFIPHLWKSQYILLCTVVNIHLCNSDISIILIFFIRTLIFEIITEMNNVLNVSYLHDFVDRFLSQFPIMLKRFCDVA